VAVSRSKGEVTSSYLERAREARKTEESAEERWSSERPMVRKEGTLFAE
jgi:hypothetical protein